MAKLNINVSGEIWKPVIGYEGFYEVSSLGRVRSVDRVHVAKSRLGNEYTRTRKGSIKEPDTSSERRRVSLYRNGKGRKYQIAHLVLFAFDALPKLPIALSSDNCQANHINGDPTDDRLSNLEWLTVKEHRRHTHKNKLNARGEQINTSKLTRKDVLEIRRLNKEGVPNTEIALRYRVAKSNITAIVNRKTWRHL